MSDHDQVPARDPTHFAELFAPLLAQTYLGGTRTVPEPRALLFGAATPFAAGFAVGWFFRKELLTTLVKPWSTPPNHICFPPHGPPGQLFTWYLLVAATVALLSSLPFWCWLTWRLLAPRSCPASFRSAFAFVSSSYLVIALGLWLAARVAFPVFLERERLSWSHSLQPAPWAYIELELQALLGYGLASQLCTISVFALVWTRFPKSPKLA